MKNYIFFGALIFGLLTSCSNFDMQKPKTTQVTTTVQQKEKVKVVTAVPKASSDDELRQRLTSIQYEVTQNGATETPYENKYWDNTQAGIYVDIIDGKALFSSTTKYKSNTGWPSFTKPISATSVVEVDDNLLWFTRTEVKGASSDSHLGHLFTDGPAEQGGLRYCLNSASLRFIAQADMQAQGYGDYLYLFD